MIKVFSLLLKTKLVTTIRLSLVIETCVCYATDSRTIIVCSLRDKFYNYLHLLALVISLHGQRMEIEEHLLQIYSSFMNKFSLIVYSTKQRRSSSIFVENLYHLSHVNLPHWLCCEGGGGRMYFLKICHSFCLRLLPRWLFNTKKAVQHLMVENRRFFFSTKGVSTWLYNKRRRSGLYFLKICTSFWQRELSHGCLSNRSRYSMRRLKINIPFLDKLCQLGHITKKEDVFLVNYESVCLRVLPEWLFNKRKEIRCVALENQSFFFSVSCVNLDEGPARTQFSRRTVTTCLRLLFDWLFNKRKEVQYLLCEDLLFFCPRVASTWLDDKRRRSRGYIYINIHNSFRLRIVSAWF